jgi:acyl carrier protein
MNRFLNLNKSFGLRLAFTKVPQQQLKLKSSFKLIATRSLSTINNQYGVVLLNNKQTVTATPLRFFRTDEKSPLTKENIEEKVITILRNFDRIKENPDKPQVGPDSNLTKDLGLDSLDQVEIIVQIEELFGNFLNFHYSLNNY